MKVAKRVMIIAAILVVIAGIAYITIARANAKKLATVTVAKAAKTTLTRTVSVTGNIEANNVDTITLGANQKVSDVLVQEGQKVTKGQTLVKLDTTDLQYQLKKARLNQQLNGISTTTDNAAAENQISQAQLNLDIAQRTLANDQKAVNDTKKAMDADKKLLDAGKISADVYGKDVEKYNTAVGQVKNDQNQIQLKQIDLKNAQANLNNVNQSNSQQKDKARIQSDMTQSDIDYYESQIAKSDIKADISGTVIQMDAKANEIPQQGNNTIQIYDLSKYKMTADVAQYDAVNVKVGQEANISVKGLTKKYTGTVTKIDNVAESAAAGSNSSLTSVANQSSNTDTKVKAEITLDNPDNNIKVGFEADADIITSQKPDVVAVSFDAIKTDSAGQKYVFTVQNNRLKRINVTTGIETDFDVEITSGLKEDDEYITSPADTLKENDMVKVKGSGSSTGRSSAGGLFRMAGGGGRAH